ncbi:MAG: phosphodiester glycosidase family protein, partial [Planctomycetes bacterium]|nr:phosphodiester glycosidase family protein [Planctomycetota bacterium]
PAESAPAVGGAPRGSWWAVVGAGPGAWVKVHFGGRPRWIDGSALARPGVPFFVDLGWQREGVSSGVVWYRRHFAELSGGPQMVNLLYADPARTRIRPLAATRPTRTSGMASAAGALAAVNGTFFSRRADGTVAPTLYLKVSNRLLNITGRPNGPVLGMDGTLELLWRYRPGTWAGVPNAIGSVGELVKDGDLVAADGDPAADYYWGRNPRTAMGLTGPGRLVLLTVDGRSSRSLGLTVAQLAALMKRVGCDQAGNLDGGGSTTMWLRPRGVVNYPSDDGVWGHAGERAVANCLAVFARE